MAGAYDELIEGDAPSRAQLVFGFLVVLATVAILVAPLPVAAAGVVVFVVSASQAPLVALCLIVLSLPFYLLDRPVGHLEFSPTEILILLSLAAGLFRAAGHCVPRGLLFAPASEDSSAPAYSGKGWAGRTSALREWIGDPTIAGLVVFIVLVGVISLTTSVAVHESLRSLRTIIVEPAAFYFLVVTQVRDRRAAFALALALVAAGVLISFVGFWQYATDQRIITAEEALRRIRGFYGSPNNLGLFLGRALPMAVALSLWWPRGRPWLIAASSVIALALLLTFSIGAWVAVGVSLLVLAALRGRRAFQVAVGMGVVGLFVVTAAALRVPRIGSHFDLGAGTTFERVLVWQSALHMLADHPIRGIGLDNFLYYYQHGYRLPAAWREPDLSHPHNLVLDFWLSLGLPGLLGLGLLLGRLGTVVTREWQASGPMERGVYAGVVGAMLDTILHGLVDNSFFLVDLSVLFWLMFAIVAVLHRAAACRESR